MNWLQIIECPNYVISDTGLIKNIRTNYIRKNMLKKDGYLHITLFYNKRFYHYLVHRLLMITFKPINFQENLQVNHINGIKTDNDITNLEWVTRSENQKHACRTGLVSNKGINNNFSILSNKDVLNIRRLSIEGVKNNVIGKLYKTSPSNVSAIINRKAWKHI